MERNYESEQEKETSKLWVNYISEDGSPSISYVNPIKVSKYDECDHYYVYTDNGNSAVCEKCGLGHRISFGWQKIVDGKIITLDRHE